MHMPFQKVIESLPEAYDKLIGFAPITMGKLPKNMPIEGVYLFSENGRHLYAGRSNWIAQRYRLHTRQGSQHNQAAFAVKLAKEELQTGPATYTRGRGNKDLAKREDFIDAFTRAKQRVKAMEFRYVAEADQPRQALLEAYVCIVAGTPYNDFDNH